MKKQRLDEIQFARALAMFSVLFVHCTSYGIANLNPESTFYPIYTTLNTIGKLGVPVFFMLSGFVLFYAYYPREFTKKLVIDFYKKRIKYIVIPYIVISSLYVTYYNILYYSYPSTTEMLKSYVTFIIHGNASYHTYFLIVLIQFYLLFPILLWVFKKITSFKSWMFIFGLVLHLVFWNLNVKYSIVSNASIVFLSYISFFLLGGQLGIYYGQVRSWIAEHKGKLVTIFGTLYFVIITTLAIMDYSIFTNKFTELMENYPIFSINGFSYYLWIAQGLVASIFLILIGLYFVEMKFEKIKTTLLNLATVSFGIYLFHPLVLNIVGKFLVTSNSMLFHVYQFLIFIIILIVSWMITKLLMKLPFGWLFIGK